ncbi:hypothetical protein MY10362_009361 [Beauveria mimosiformis]
MKSVLVVATGLAALATAQPTDKRATADPTKEQLCVGFNEDFEACQREARVCAGEIQGESSWKKISDCLEEKRPPPTKEQLCVGFNEDFEACQREAKVCDGEIQGGFTWTKIEKCLEGKRPGAVNTDTNTGTNTETNTKDFKADLRVDTNRDGVVDIEGESDVEGKANWTDTSGAIFLANIGDSGDRCKKLHSNLKTKNLAAILGELAKCHDAADDTQRAPGNMAPMRTMPIQGLSNSATGTISVSDTQVRSLVRIFRAGKDNSWEIVNKDTVFSAQDLQQGLTLGIDARDTRRNGGWDGRVTVDFTVKDGEAVSKDSVMLRVAPVLLHHHRQPIEKVFTSSFREGSLTPAITNYVQGLIKSIEDNMQRAQVPGPITQLATDDPWAQDYFEPGYTSMPGPDGKVVSLRIMIEGRHNPGRNSTGLIYTTLRGDNVGGVAAHPPPSPLTRKDSTYNAGGNMEMLPPYEHNGQKFPAGRIIVGGDQNNQPQGIDFLKAQEMQDPLVLDSAWLFVKHVDEMLQAIPVKTERRWAIVAIDPQLGLKWLRMAEERGLGGEPVVNGKVVKSGPTISQFLAEPENIQAAQISSDRMTANLELLKKETGITDAEIFRVPALIAVKTTAAGYLAPKQKRSIATREDEAEEAALDAEFLELIDEHGPGGDARNETAVTKRRREIDVSKPFSLESLLPSLVNGLPLSDSHYVAPKPFGPLINGRDMFEILATSAYKEAGYTTVEFVDDWRFHLASGDLHCFSNTYRDASQPWWLK